MTTKQPERSVEEIVEEFKGTLWHSRLKEFDRTTDDEEERDHPTEMFISWLTQTLQAERQRCEEMVEDGRVSVLEDFDSLMQADAFMGLTDDEWKAVQKFFRYNDEISGWKLTQPNNTKLV